jgi:MEKHLA domain
MNKADPEFFDLLVSSYRRFVGVLAVFLEGGHHSAEWLYEDASYCVLAHNTDAVPRFIYANKAAQACFEYDCRNSPRFRPICPRKNPTARTARSSSMRSPAMALPPAIPGFASPNPAADSASRMASCGACRSRRNDLRSGRDLPFRPLNRATFDVPGMGSMTGLRFSTQASA